MNRWEKFGSTWCLWPEKPNGLIEMIGGSYLAAKPQICYKRLLESLYKRNLAIHTWSYIPGLDHQTQANEAWKDLRKCKINLENKLGQLPLPIRIGHSLGCKLHLLAPDRGRNSKSLITLGFNNYSATKSIPMFKRIQSGLNTFSEFSPSPKETLRLIVNQYIQPNNTLIKFQNDSLDQSNILLGCLNKRENDQSERIILPGDHLTPASAGLRENLLGEWADDNFKLKCIWQLVEKIMEIYIK